MKMGDGVYAVWVDSSSCSGWMQVDEIPNRPMRCKTLGWFVEQSKTGVVIALNKASVKRSRVPFGDYVLIPRCALVSLKKVELP